MYTELMQLISTLGFPIAVSVFLLVRLEKKLDDLTKAFLELSKSIQTALEHQKSKDI
ncbi:YvrJ family protein (plasmid) [Haloimpatiens sp. FM7330]|uniref:YvrJ family protein n=1 Tax=Haloimpatiens sp. FM7330 TaxID=3298610 RepID=UPI003643EB16